jgi:8-oxo-dGTP diphosphatase
MSPALIVSALVRRDGRILLVEEREAGDPSSTWMLPGGRVEANETLLEALRRELHEETGLVVIGDPQVAFVADLRGDHGPWIAITFDVATTGTVRPDDPDGLVLGAAWLELDDALARLSEVAWYDSSPLERYVRGIASPGAAYGAHPS